MKEGSQPIRAITMTKPSKQKNDQEKIDSIKWKIKTRKFQKEAIYRCLPGKKKPDIKIRNVNDTVWDVILFIGLNAYSPVPLTASDIYLGTGLPKRTVIRIIDRLESLNVIKKTADGKDRRVTRIGFSTAFSKLFDKHLQDYLNEYL